MKKSSDTAQCSTSPEDQKRRKNKYFNMLVILVILIGVSVYSAFNGSNAVKFDWDGTVSVTVTDPDGNAHTIRYAEVTNAALIDQPDFGSCISGNEAHGWRYGIWENDLWSTYYLCTWTDTTICIVLQTELETYVISYESDEITSALYDNIAEFIADANEG